MIGAPETVREASAILDATATAAFESRDTPSHDSYLEAHRLAWVLAWRVNAAESDERILAMESATRPRSWVVMQSERAQSWREHITIAFEAFREQAAHLPALIRLVEE